jgi:HK97 gp10 family phage protein
MGSLTIRGNRELGIALERLPKRVFARVMRPAVNAALTPINKAAKRKAPKETGALQASLGKKVRQFPATGTTWGAVGPRDDPKFRRPDPTHPNRPRRPIFYAHIVEAGTRTQAAQPFLRPALDEQGDAALHILYTKTAAGIEREAARLGRGA